MILDHNSVEFHRFRSRLSYVVLPIQYAVGLPIDLMNRILSDVSTHQTLLKENAHLRTQNLLLQAKLQKQYAIEFENKQLRALLWSASKTGGKILEAQLLAIEQDPFLNKVIINRGRQDGVFKGQPVLDARGVMGQVIQTGYLTSVVMLLTDPKSSIPVQIQRNGVRAILNGSGGFDSLKLVHVTSTTDVRIGDVLITSGLGGRYPFGYPVGTVISVDRSPTHQFSDITVKPAARLNRSRLVLLIWSVKKKIDVNIKTTLRQKAKHISQGVE